ncbi:YD repeat-containing protein [Leucobacter luti]|uniref:ABC transporter n=1 Tax=Leucobacter luti TaxID=340320 RepID=UPI00104CBFD5|nr:ABC transporter [Leucobacter luti]MCW2288384.1 YD repeat-containing protein [Leucobacter luti]TCK45459.1 YD repeat-containing protein [Leucobacter luti]
MNPLRPIAASCGLILTLSIVACTPPGAQPPNADDLNSSSAAESKPGHGAVAGASEESEAQLQLLTVDTTGRVGLLDLLDSSEREIARITAPAHLSSDGRYGFAAHAAGVEIVDSGVWTWDHGDHSHYYRSEPGLLGSVAGEGIATVIGGQLSTAGGTGVFFPTSGDAVLLDNAALAHGSVEELFRVRVSPHSGLIAPFADGAVVSETDASGHPSTLRYISADGSASDHTAACDHPHSALHTRAGLVVICTGGAVVGTTASDGTPEFDFVASPVQGAVLPTMSGRKGRPVLAGPSPDTGITLFDSRARTWDSIQSEFQFIAAGAVDDAESHVVAVDTTGRVHVFRDGRAIAVTTPLLTATDLTASTHRGEFEVASIALSLDANRAYLASPERATVTEIDFADNARISREFQPKIAPAAFAETGR